MTTGKSHAAGRTGCAARLTLCMAALLSAFLFSGCGAGGYLSDKLPYSKLAIPYAAAQIGRSTSLDVLNLSRDGAYEFDPGQVDQALLTQSDTAVAYSGRSRDTRKSWLNLIAFDEYRMVARRKYFFSIDERLERVPDNPKKLLFPPRKGIVFDAQFVIDPEVLTTPYATEEAQQAAIVRWLAGQFERDIVALIGDPKKPAQGSEVIVLSDAMVRQVFQSILVELARSPGLAKNLADEQGVRFPHMSLGKGHIRMVTQNDLGAVKIRVNLSMTDAE